VSRSAQAQRGQQLRYQYLLGWEATMALLRRGRSWSGHERNCVYLNCGPGAAAFANVSAASGLDFADDGRALAVVDWDHDGDLDLWLRNRTGPRLRLMLNQNRGQSFEGEVQNSGPALRRTPAFVALRLEGTTCNRDAIGARVEVVLDQESNIKDRTLIRALRAGDAFLSQSSKWLHFGLGTHATIEAVVVRWPGGQSERFQGVKPDGHFVLVQGNGRAGPWQRPSTGGPNAPVAQIKLTPSPQPHFKTTDTARLFFAQRVPLPILRYTRAGDAVEHVVETGSAPLLVNFWASSCLPCVAELNALSEHEDELRESGLNVLALSLDGLGENTAASDAQSLLEKLGFPFETGFATSQLLDKIELVQEMLFSRRRPFIVPISLLLDRQGRLAAIYRGPVQPKVVVRDVLHLETKPGLWKDLSVPFPGRWASQPGGVHLGWMVKWFEASHPEDAAMYLGLYAEQLAAALERTNSAESRRRLETELADTLFKWGRALRDLKRPDEAANAYERLVRLQPDHDRAHYALALARMSAGRLAESVKSFRRSLELEPDWLLPMNNLAWILATSAAADLRDGAEAVRLAERAAELTRHENPIILSTLSAAYAQKGRFDLAIETAQKAVELATATNDPNLADQIRQHVDLYKQDRPVRDP